MYDKFDPITLIRRKFGNLTVEQYDGYRNSKHYYRCRCDCGGSVVVHKGRLLSGAKTNCGCKREPVLDESIIGRRFGRLTVVKNLGSIRRPKRRVHYYLCQCDCGRTSIVNRTQLLNFESTSCGDCTRIEKEDTFYRYYCNDGNSFIFDAEDLELVQKYRWYMSNGYPVTRSDRGKYEKLTRLMYGLSKDDKIDIDHIDGDPGNNRRSNLRVVPHLNNMSNTKIRADNTSGYKGVSYDKRRGKYYAQISERGNHHYLGRFNTAIEAAGAYDRAARYYFGEFACVNFPEKGEQCCFRNEGPSDSRMAV